MYVKKILPSLGAAVLFCLLCVQGVMQVQAQSDETEEIHVTVYCNTPIWYVDSVTNESFVEVDVMVDSESTLVSSYLPISYYSKLIESIGTIEGDTLPLPLFNFNTADNGNDETRSILHYGLGTNDRHASGNGLQLATLYLKVNESLDVNDTLITFENNIRINDGETNSVVEWERDEFGRYHEISKLVIHTESCAAGENVVAPESKSLDSVMALFPSTPQPDQNDPVLATMEMTHVYCDVPIETVTRDGESAVGIKIWADIPKSEQINQHALWLGYDAEAYEYVDVEENSLFFSVFGKENLLRPFTDEIDSPVVLENVDAYSGLIAYVAGVPEATHWGGKVLLATVYMKPLVNDTTISPVSLVIPPQGNGYEERGTTTYNDGFIYPVTVGECNNSVVTLRNSSFRPETMSDNAQELPTHVGLQSQGTTTTTVTMIIVLVTSLGASTLWLSTKRNIA